MKKVFFKNFQKSNFKKSKNFKNQNFSKYLSCVSIHNQNLLHIFVHLIDKKC